MQQPTFRPPAVPLITVDPFFSVWSFADRLNDDVTRHWTGVANNLLGIARIDGMPVRFMGLESEDRSRSIGELPAMEQIGLTVTATRTCYVFQSGGVRLEVTFMAPLLMDDLQSASRPVNYLTLAAYSCDSQPHRVDVYLDLSSAICCDREADCPVTGESVRIGGLPGAKLQNRSGRPPLSSSGDNQRIDWGSVYVLSLDPDATAAPVSGKARDQFATIGAFQAEVSPYYGQPSARDAWPLAAVQLSVPVQAERSAAGQTTVLLLAYEDGVSIDYFGRHTPAYCFRDGADFASIICDAARGYDRLLKRCQAFDDHLAELSRQAGGQIYADLTALAYRQAFAAHKLIADEDGNAVFLSKECFSNGCIGTVDVSYPSMPLFLLFNPELVRGMLRPVFRFAASPAWPYDFAPHDVGQYPLANGQVYGLQDGQYLLHDQMPVEECGNMLIMTAAACRADGHYELAEKHLDTLDQWAGYLQQYGQDPGEQLCTDDFAGHLAHNANLSIKAIVGLGAYAQILTACGKTDKAARILATARSMARVWLEMADDQDHTRLTFNQPGSWSMKYNLLFDQLLGLELFPGHLYQQELTYWQSRQNRYGLPLDSRAAYTKADWLVWCAALSRDPDVVTALLEPLHRYYSECGSRVPMTDWYDTQTGRALHFRNRTVIGGIFALLLRDKGPG